MTSQILTPRNLQPIVIALLPLSLWMMLILSLQPGSLRDIGNPGSGFAFLHGVRAALPLIAAFLATVIIAFKMRRQPPNRVLFVGPMGLAAMYGLVGVVASTLSPNGSTALYWAVAYLSVPLVLWALVWGPNSLDLLSRIVNLNLLIMILASVALFAFAMVKLNLGGFILDPSRWTECISQGWFNASSQYIRDTGVGRYAALTAIIALGRFWQPGWRSLWTLIFLASLILLLFSGARTPMVGFAVAAPLVLLLSGGKKAALGSVAVIVVLTSVFWATSLNHDFINDCIFRSVNTSASNTETADPTHPLSSAPVASTSLTSSSDVNATPDGPDPLATQVPAPTTPVGPSPSETQVPARTTPVGPSTSATPVPASGVTNVPVVSPIARGFFSLTGRTEVWRQALSLFRESPLLGYGFHADRILLGTHTHNTLVHSLIQTGLIGTIPFMAALLMGWILLFKSLRRLNRLAAANKILVVQTAGIFAFLSIRTITESTGAFFSVDWLILGPLLLYVGVVNPPGAQEGTA